MVNPEKEYTQQIDALQQSLAKILRLDTWIVNTRLILFLIIAIFAIAFYKNIPLTLFGLGITSLLFIGLLFFHALLIKRKEETDKSNKF